MARSGHFRPDPSSLLPRGRSIASDRVSRGRTRQAASCTTWTRRRHAHVTRRPDELIVEEPLEIRLDGHLVTTTMRTPGHDFELAAGLCFTDGLLAGAPVTGCRYCGDGQRGRHRVQRRHRRDRRAWRPCPTPGVATTTSSCGLCGSASIDDLAAAAAPAAATSTPSPLDVLAAARRGRATEQELFGATGAVHAAAAFDRRRRDRSCVREDIGRHNAVDKVVGRLLLDGRLPADRPRPVRQRPGQLRDRAEGVGRRLRARSSR